MIVAKADEAQELRNNFVLCFSTLIFYSKLQMLRATSTTKVVSLEIIVHILHSTKGLRLLSHKTSIQQRDCACSTQTTDANLSLGSPCVAAC